MEPGQERTGQSATPPPLPRRAVRPTPRRPPRVDPLRSPVTGRVTPSAAVISRPFLVLLPVVAFLVPGLMLALTQPPTYTAEARLLVGGFDVRAQAVPGFVAAANTLAATYARLVETPAIANPVAEALDIPPGEVDLSATSVPESSIIKISGSSPDEELAVQLAAAASEALLDYAGETRRSAAASEEVFEEFQDAARLLTEAQAELDRIEAAIAADPSPSGTLRQQLALAQATVSAAQLRADTLAERYAQTEQTGGSGAGIDLVAPASLIGDDRRSTIQLAVAAAVGLGLVVGVALATLVVNRQAANARSREAVGDAAAA